MSQFVALHILVGRFNMEQNTSLMPLAREVRKNMVYRKRLHQVRQGLKLWGSTRWQDKPSITRYLLSNMVAKTFSLHPRGREFALQLSGFDITCRTHSSQLGAYIDIFLDHIYEKVDRFTPAPGSTVFDLGANIGFYTLMVGAAVGPSGRVYAFEPNPKTFELLTANVRANGMSWATCYPYAVTDQSLQELSLWTSDDRTSTSSLLYDAERSGDTVVPVPGICLDDFVEQHRIENVDILKMDTEGSETLIVKGGLQRALPVTQRVVMESHNTRYDVRDLLAPLGFDMVLETRPENVVYFSKGAMVQ